jgi:hypothetical protein
VNGWPCGVAGFQPAMKSFLRQSLRIVAATVICTCPATARTWTDVQGRKLDGELVSSNATDATLKLATGKTVTIPLAKLSAEDRKFISEQTDKNEGSENEALNFNKPWPDNVKFDEDPQVEIVTEDKENNRYVYESASFRFVSDVRLSKQVVKGFALMFESTFAYCRALPLAISGGVKTDGKFQILLFEKKESYVNAGGPPDSAGVFIGGKQVVMVPLTSVGVKQVGSGYMLDRDVSNRTLIHELTHQLTPTLYYGPGALGWFTEGIAEYVAATPYRHGRFKVKSNFDDVVAYATAYAKDDNRGRALGQEITAPALKDFFQMPYSAFTGNDGNFNYGLALILTTYFLHLDGEGDAARMKDFLKALRAGKKGQEAIDALLGGRSYAEMEEAVSKGWRRKGVKIEFRKSNSSGNNG